LRATTTLPIIAVEPEGDKVMRMSNCSPTVEAGNVALPEVAEWLHDFETEISNFPNGAHRDRGDSFSQYLNWVKNNTSALGDFGAVGQMETSHV